VFKQLFEEGLYHSYLPKLTCVTSAFPHLSQSVSLYAVPQGFSLCDEDARRGLTAGKKRGRRNIAGDTSTPSSNNAENDKPPARRRRSSRLSALRATPTSSTPQPQLTALTPSVHSSDSATFVLPSLSILSPPTGRPPPPPTPPVPSALADAAQPPAALPYPSEPPVNRLPPPQAPYLSRGDSTVTTTTAHFSHRGVTYSQSSGPIAPPATPNHPTVENARPANSVSAQAPAQPAAAAQARIVPEPKIERKEEEETLVPFQDVGLPDQLSDLPFPLPTTHMRPILAPNYDSLAPSVSFFPDDLCPQVDNPAFSLALNHGGIDSVSSDTY
jgi:hypothetical protein